MFCPAFPLVLNSNLFYSQALRNETIIVVFANVFENKCSPYRKHNVLHRKQHVLQGCLFTSLSHYIYIYMYIYIYIVVLVSIYLYIYIYVLYISLSIYIYIYFLFIGLYIYIYIHIFVIHIYIYI